MARPGPLRGHLPGSAPSLIRRWVLAAPRVQGHGTLFPPALGQGHHPGGTSSLGQEHLGAPPELVWEDLGLPHTGAQHPQGFSASDAHPCAAPTSFAAIPAQVPSPASDGGCHEASAVPAVPIPAPLGPRVAGGPRCPQAPRRTGAAPALRLTPPRCPARGGHRGHGDPGMGVTPGPMESLVLPVPGHPSGRAHGGRG